MSDKVNNYTSSIINFLHFVAVAAVCMSGFHHIFQHALFSRSVLNVTVIISLTFCYNNRFAQFVRKYTHVNFILRTIAGVFNYGTFTEQCLFQFQLLRFL